MAAESRSLKEMFRSAEKKISEQDLPDFCVIDFEDELDNERSCESANSLMEKLMENLLELQWDDFNNFPPIPGWCSHLKCVGCNLSKSDKWYMCPAAHFLCQACFEDHIIDKKPFCPAPIIQMNKTLNQPITGRCATTPLEYDWNAPLGKLRRILETKERRCCLDASEDHRCNVIIKDAIGGQAYERHFELCDFFEINGCPFKSCFRGEMSAFQLVDHLMNEHGAEEVVNDTINQLQIEKPKFEPYDGAKNNKGPAAIRIFEDAFSPPRATNDELRQKKLAESIIVPYVVKHDGVHFFMVIRRSEKGIQGWVSLMECNNLDDVKYSANVYISSDPKRDPNGKEHVEQFIWNGEAIRRYEVPEIKTHAFFTMDWKTLEQKYARSDYKGLVVNFRIFIKRVD